jgi:hypothetical protein
VLAATAAHDRVGVGAFLSFIVHLQLTIEEQTTLIHATRTELREVKDNQNELRGRVGLLAFHSCMSSGPDRGRWCKVFRYVDPCVSSRTGRVTTREIWQIIVHLQLTIEEQTTLIHATRTELREVPGLRIVRAGRHGRP